jgi:hypothetical protein
VSQSSTDSDFRFNGSPDGRISRNEKFSGGKQRRFLHRSTSCTGFESGLLHHRPVSSSGVSSSGSDTSSGHMSRYKAPSPSSDLHQRSSLKKVFQSLTRNSRSRSASYSDSNSSKTDTSNRRISESSANGGKKKKKKNKGILRAPVTYAYVKGLSGLPTQRVPRRYPCAHVPSVVCYGSSNFGTHHLADTNR